MAATHDCRNCQVSKRCEIRVVGVLAWTVRLAIWSVNLDQYTDVFEKVCRQEGFGVQDAEKELVIRKAIYSPIPVL